jgi:hypothetical protein
MAAILSCYAFSMSKNPFRRRAVNSFFALLLLATAGCKQHAEPHEALLPFQLTGLIYSKQLNEISGIQADNAFRWWVHNDDGVARIHLVSLAGDELAAMQLKGAENHDWEDLAAVPRGNGRLLVVGDIGDNDARRKNIQLYFIQWPQAEGGGAYPKTLDVLHTASLSYPDGPRDCESMAYDPSSGQILLMSKRDVPPRLYGVAVETALAQRHLMLDFLVEVQSFRPATTQDLLLSPLEGAWVSQPTGMDISADGLVAAVITERSLYLFQREKGQSWPQAFLESPLEIPGPPTAHEEAVGISPDGHSLVVTTEGLSAPIYRLELTGKKPAQTILRP